jgi:DNA transformation protein
MAPVSKQPPFVDHCVELLAPLGAVRVKRMFGGWGLYVDTLFIAILASDQLYLKTDASSREVFAAAGCTPFVYSSDGQSVSLGYWSAPDDALESPAQMAPWARLALQSAVAARAARLTKPRRAVGKKTASAARTPKVAPKTNPGRG